MCGVAAIIPAYIIIAASHTQYMFFTGMALYAFGECACVCVCVTLTILASACVVPCLTTLSGNHATDADRGAITGVLRSQGALARALGPCFGAARECLCLFIIY
jgi:hypothetical protein